MSVKMRRPSLVCDLSEGYRVITYTDPWGGGAQPSRVDFDSMADALSHIYGVQMTEGVHVSIYWRDVEGKLRSRHGRVGNGGIFEDIDGSGSDYGCP